MASADGPRAAGGPGAWRHKRVGLVLAGGGAKGAYQIGCLRALRRAGITRFEAVAGTSVGAIHGVMLVAGKLDEAEATWRGIRFRDVLRLATERLHLLPLWVLAALNSEFSPLKVWRLSDSVTHPRRWRRWVYPAACVVTALLFFAAGRFTPAHRAGANAVATLFGLCGALAALHGRLRLHFLGSAFVSNQPLAAIFEAALTEADCSRLSAANVRVYATVSRFQPYTHESIPWGGWVPQYVRLDGLPLTDMLDVLVAGSAMPGFSTPRLALGKAALDGAWTDNVPVAPLLFEPDLDLDLVFVVYLKKIVRHSLRHNSLHGVASLLIAKQRAKRGEAVDNLLRWAQLRWQASSAGRSLPREVRRLPLVVPVAPSVRIGNFFTGTLWCSPARSKQLIELGERDMDRILAGLAGPNEERADSSGRHPAHRRRPDSAPAESAQALS